MGSRCENPAPGKPGTGSDEVPERQEGHVVPAFVRRLASARRHVEHLIRSDVADANRYRLDLDSHQLAAFDEIDREELTPIAALVGAAWPI